MSRALVGARERLKQRVLADSALVGAGQRWWAMIQVLLQLTHRVPPSKSGSRTPHVTLGRILEQDAMAFVRLTS